MNNNSPCQIHITSRLAKDLEIVDGTTCATIDDSEIDLNEPDKSKICDGIVRQTIGTCIIAIENENIKNENSDDCTSSLSSLFVINNIILKDDFPKEDIYNIMSKYISGINPDHINLINVLGPEIIKKTKDYELIRTTVIYAISLESGENGLTVEKVKLDYSMN